MSLIPYWKRVSPDTLAALRQKTAAEVAEVLREGESFDVDRVASAIHFTLTGDAEEGDWPLSGAVMGGSSFPDAGWDGEPPRFLFAEEVKEVSEALDEVTERKFVKRYSPAKLFEEDIEPGLEWDDEKDWIIENYMALREFFREAADAGDAMIIWRQ